MSALLHPLLVSRAGWLTPGATTIFDAIARGWPTAQPRDGAGMERFGRNFVLTTATDRLREGRLAPLSQNGLLARASGASRKHGQQFRPNVEACVNCLAGIEAYRIRHGILRQHDQDGEIILNVGIRGST